MQAAISPASASDSSPRVWASQIRTSTVPKRWCGRTLHQSWVDSTTEPVRSSRLDEVGVALPVAERRRDPAAREGAGEDLGADRVQAGVAAVEERRVGGDGEQQRQQLAQPVADGDRPVGAADAHVDVQAPGVVALGDPAEFVAQPVVVRRVDDPLVEVVGPGVGAGRAERQPHAGDQLEQPRPALALARHRLGEALGAAGADLDLGGDQLARPPTRPAPRPPGRPRRRPRSGARARASPGRGSRTPPRGRS